MRNDKEQAPQQQEPPVNPRHLVTLEAKQPFRKGDRDRIFVQVIRAAGSGQVCEVDVRTTMITFNLRSRAAVERVLAAGATLNSEPLVVYDGRKPRKPPSVRVLFFELGFGWTPDHIVAFNEGINHIVISKKKTTGGVLFVSHCCTNVDGSSKENKKDGYRLSLGRFCGTCLNNCIHECVQCRVWQLVLVDDVLNELEAICVWIGYTGT